MTVEGTSGPSGPGAVIYEFRRSSAGTKIARLAPSAGDAAAITDKARHVGKASTVVENSTEIRPDRVRELKAAIAGGTYQADDREVAKKLLARGL